MSRRPVTALATCSLLLLAACGADAVVGTPPASTSAIAPTTTAVPSTTNPVSTDPVSTDPVSTDPPATTSSAPPTTVLDLSAFPVFMTLPITDVDGLTFALVDLVGTPVVVEAFATWCPKCRDQLERTNAAAAELGTEAVVLALSVETDLGAGDVAAYAERNGFSNVRFAVMTPEMLAAMVDALGNSVANPPSTPIVVIDSAGRPGELSTGGASTGDLVAAARAANVSIG
jgi:thiol-disulfide isomerase/thioredoxin